MQCLSASDAKRRRWCRNRGGQGQAQTPDARIPADKDFLSSATLRIGALLAHESCPFQLLQLCLSFFPFFPGRLTTFLLSPTTVHTLFPNDDNALLTLAASFRTIDRGIHQPTNTKAEPSNLPVGFRPNRRAEKLGNQATVRHCTAIGARQRRALRAGWLWERSP